MRNYLAFIAAVLSLTGNLDALGRPLVASDRFVTLQEGEAEVGLDLSVGLSKGRRGEEFAIASGYRPDRHEGLSFAYGVLDELEIGASFAISKWDEAKGGRFGGSELYATFGFLPFLGVEGAFLVQGRDFLDPSLRLGIPFRFPVLESLLAVFWRFDFMVRFGSEETLVDLFGHFGFTWNVLPWLYLEGYGGVERGEGAKGPLFRTYEKTTGLGVPAGLGLGVTFARRYDLLLSFNFEDLKGKGIDGQDLCLRLRAFF